MFGSLHIIRDLLYRLLYGGSSNPLQDNLRIILWELKKPLGIFRRVLSIVQYMSYKEGMKGTEGPRNRNTLYPVKLMIKLYWGLYELAAYLSGTKSFDLKIVLNLSVSSSVSLS